ncbi:MAG: glucan biosynthesis protein [Wenzhouxiangella sp.]
MIRRRQLLATALGAVWVPALSGIGVSPFRSALASVAGAGVPDSPARLIEMAESLAARAYQPSPAELAAPFDQLDYDRYRGVRPIAGKAADLPVGEQFRADLLPPGWLFRDPVQIALPGHDLAFSHDLFDFDPRLIDWDGRPVDTGRMGFSGLRLRHRLNRPDQWDDVLVLQGASYFRALARDTAYGLSARILAIGTGGAVPEEFPVTRKMIVFEADDELFFGCLVDSPSASAAFLARLSVSDTTSMDCQLHLFPRESLDEVGIAPLTSMFQHNDLGPARIDDFRPAVHDSDVLVMVNGAGEQLWRPLGNPDRLALSRFSDENSQGFGLLQSPTAFERFRDGEAAYHRRPSAWVRPQSSWGPGAVMLLEIPTRDEFADNIVAFWRPAQSLQPGHHRFDYRLDWLAPGLAAFPGVPARFPLTIKRSASGIEPNHRQGRLYVIDFIVDGQQDTQALERLANGSQLDFGPVDPEGRLTGQALYPLQGQPGVLRASFILEPADGVDAIELRLQIRDNQGRPLSAVWLWRWSRRADGKV